MEEIIKKTIKQALTTGTTETCNGDCKIIIPDLNAVYHIKLLLVSKAFDFGHFDAYPDYVPEDGSSYPYYPYS